MRLMLRISGEHVRIARIITAACLLSYFQHPPNGARSVKFTALVSLVATLFPRLLGTSQELDHAIEILRTASRMEQVNAPARAYHQQMKRDLPVTCCTECGGVGYNIRVANGRCSKTIGGQRCSGVNAIAAKSFDWIECIHCEATGYYRNKECPQCKGAGYLFVGLRSKETVA
jgi:hypothetical protein